MPDLPTAEDFLRQWCAEVETAKIPAFMKFANTVPAYGAGIFHFVESRLTYGILEGINSKIQLVKVEPGSEQICCWQNNQVSVRLLAISDCTGLWSNYCKLAS